MYFVILLIILIFYPFLGYIYLSESCHMRTHGTSREKKISFLVLFCFSNYVFIASSSIWTSNRLFFLFSDPNKPNNISSFGNSSLLWRKYSDERQFLRFSTNMTPTMSQGTRFGEPATSFWTTLVPVLLEGSPPPQFNDKRVETVFTAFRITSDKIEITIISLLTISSGLLVITVLLIICSCKYVL